MLNFMKALFLHVILAITFRHNGANLPRTWGSYLFLYILAVGLAYFSLLARGQDILSYQLALKLIVPVVGALVIGIPLMVPPCLVAIGIHLTALLIPSAPDELLQMWQTAASMLLLFRCIKLEATYQR